MDKTTALLIADVLQTSRQIVRYRTCQEREGEGERARERGGINPIDVRAS